MITIHPVQLYFIPTFSLQFFHCIAINAHNRNRFSEQKDEVVGGTNKLGADGPKILRYILNCVYIIFVGKSVLSSTALSLLYILNNRGGGKVGL